MKKFIALLILVTINFCLAGISLSEPEPVSEGINMAAEVGGVFSFTLGTHEINFGKYIPGEQQPASQTVEITCNVNAVGPDDQWKLSIIGGSFAGNTIPNNVLEDSPAFWVRKPTVSGDYRIPQGEINPLYSGELDPVSGFMQIGVMPVCDWFYKSSLGERGRGILLLINFSPNFPANAQPDTYSTYILITLELEENGGDGTGGPTEPPYPRPSSPTI